MTPSKAVVRAAKAIAQLSPPEKLRLAADLLDRRMAKTAYPIIDQVATELGAALCLARPEARKAEGA